MRNVFNFKSHKNWWQFSRAHQSGVRSNPLLSVIRFCALKSCLVSWMKTLRSVPIRQAWSILHQQPVIIRQHTLLKVISFYAFTYDVISSQIFLDRCAFVCFHSLISNMLLSVLRVNEFFSARKTSKSVIPNAWHSVLFIHQCKRSIKFTIR